MLGKNHWRIQSEFGHTEKTPILGQKEKRLRAKIEMWVNLVF